MTIPFARIRDIIAEEYASLEEVYRHLHAHPELSFHEESTATRLADELRRTGYDVTRNIGGHGVVGLLKNGTGPTVLVRADMDALPVEERTALPYRSRVTVKDDHGKEVSVMHACGHDVHMTVLVGTARTLARMRGSWQGGVLLVGQPAEEKSSGALAMIREGLFENFPRPDCCLALHVSASMPAGTVGCSPGHSWAHVDMLDISVRGIGGHGAAPQSARDPIVLTAQAVLAFQTIISREIDPLDPAVLTIGSVHGGAAYNVIPDEVRLQATLRTYTDRVRDHVLESMTRILKGIARAAGIPEDRLPYLSVTYSQPAVYNDPSLTRRLAGVFRETFGDARVMDLKPEMVGEDFGHFGLVEPKIPICIFRLGAARPEALEEHRRKGTPLPSLHSSVFAPPPEPTITTGVEAMAAAVLSLLSPGQSPDPGDPSRAEETASG